MIYTYDTCSNLCGGKAYGLSLLSKMNIRIPKGIIVKSFKNEKSDEIAIKDFISHFSKSQKFAVRSSANVEDGEFNSFAGIFETMLNVDNDYLKIKEAISFVLKSSTSDVVKSYTNNNKVEMSVIIQEMIKPVYSGVCFTNALNVNGKRAAMIEIVEGEGDKLVSGIYNSSKMVIPYINGKFEENYCEYSGNFINLYFIQQLITIINKINKTYPKGVDIEWCVDNKNRTFITQMRPITKPIYINKEYSNSEGQGIIITNGNVRGNAYFIDFDLPYESMVKSINEFPEGSILISQATETYFLPAMKKASAIITELGSVLCHAAILARELNIPCVVACKDITKKVKTGDKIELDTIHGIIKINNNEIYLNKKFHFNYSDLDCFENYFEYSLRDQKVFIELTYDGIIIHSNEKLDGDNREELELFVRLHFGICPKYSEDNNKYLWIMEIERFKKLPLFLQFYSEINQAGKNLDADFLNTIKDQLLLIVKKLVKALDSCDDELLKIFIKEYCAAINELLVGVIPFGQTLLESYNQSIQLLEKENINFNDLLNKQIQVKDKKLKKICEFLQCLSEIKNSTYQKIWDMGAMDPDYFEKRDGDIAELLKIRNINYKNENVVDAFYDAFLGEEIEKLNIILKG